MNASTDVRNETMSTGQLAILTPGQLVPFGGDRVAVVSDALAASFRAGDRLVVVQDTGDLLHIPAAEHARVHEAVTTALDAFHALADVRDEQISGFFEAFANRLADDAVFGSIAVANDADVAAAAARGRSTARLVLSPKMRADMVSGLRVWQYADARRDVQLDEVRHDEWTVETRRAPLGVVGFVFEGRPNVFADATGVLRTGNTVVFRIGSDALGPARAIMSAAVVPALAAAGLPVSAVRLIDAAAHAAGWALFADPRLALAVARGSGRTVAQLGAVARQHGVPASLHGTGGAWMVVAADADADQLALAVRHSLDRKVCNTLHVGCLVRDGAERLAPRVLAAGRAAALARGARLVVHATPSAAALAGSDAIPQAEVDLGTEWEWEHDPELTLVVVDDVSHGVALFNRYSPRFAASLISDDEAAHARFYATIDAPFVGNGFTRWVDGQFAFDRPELGLSNWQTGRLLGRGGVLSGDSVHTVRTRARVRDHGLHR